MEFKKHLFLIGTCLVVILGIATYSVEIYWLASEAEQARQSFAAPTPKKEGVIMADFAKKVDDFKKFTARIKNGEIKTADHVVAAGKFKKTILDETELVKKIWAENEFNEKFVNFPLPEDANRDARKFDEWLKKCRMHFEEEALATGLVVSRGLDDFYNAFKNPTDPAGKPELHQDYRRRRMAILDEVLTVLFAGEGERETQVFPSTNINKSNNEYEKKTEVVRALEFKRLEITPQSNSARKELWKKTIGRYVTWSERGVSTPSAAEELPFNYTVVTVDFLAPFVVLPRILKGLESSNRFVAVVTKINVDRAGAPFPDYKDPNNEKTLTASALNPSPYLNSYFLEGPINVSLTFEIVEYKGP